MGNWRTLKIYARRTHREWALVVKDLVDVHYPHAKRITVVLDHLNTHVGVSLYKVLAPAEARRLLDKLDLQHTPTRGSWLTMAEIEFGVFSRQCLTGRIGGSEFSLSEGDTRRGYHPSVAFDNAGNMVVLYQGTNDKKLWYVHGRLDPSGRLVGQETLLDMSMDRR